jgi:dolichol-phosphate mannosyltransferase
VSGKTAIVTGGTGFVGANLVRRLLADGHEVHLLVRPKYNPWRIETIRQSIHIHVLDIAESESVKLEIGRIRPDWVFHLATHGAYSWQSDLQEIVRTNIMGTFNLVEACLITGFEAFINSGTSSEYGYKDHGPSETEWLEPNSYYAVTKASASMFCRYRAQETRANIITLRLYSVYGPYEEPNRLVPALITFGLDGGYPKLASPEVARDYVFIEDVVDAYLVAASSPGVEPGAVYNVGTGVQTTLREIVDIARRVMGIGSEPVLGSMENRGWDTSTWVADSSRIQRDLGWVPKHSMEEGLRRTVDWFLSSREVSDFYRRNLLTARDGHDRASSQKRPMRSTTARTKRMSEE